MRGALVDPVLGVITVVVIGLALMATSRPRGGGGVAVLGTWSLTVPSGAVENEDRVGTGSDGLGDLTQMDLHGSRIAKGQDPGGSRAPLGADGAKEMGPCGALIMGHPALGLIVR